VLSHPQIHLTTVELNQKLLPLFLTSLLWLWAHSCHVQVLLCNCRGCHKYEAR
jgi:hypothetical protein